MNLSSRGLTHRVNAVLPKQKTIAVKAALPCSKLFMSFFLMLALLGLHQNLQAQLNTAIDLSTYVRTGRYDLPEPTRTAAPPNSLLAQEASGVAYNWDTHTLFVVGDGGTSVVQVSKTGQLINSMTLAPGGSPQGTAFYDPEGITYVGNGQFVLSEERDRQAVLFTYVAGAVLTRAAAKTVKLGTFVPNIGIEGICYDPLTIGFICVKEIQPEGIFQTGIDFVNGTATNGSPTTVNSIDLFNPALTGLSDFADVFALSNIPGLTGLPNFGNLLVLSQQDGKIVNIDRSGNISSSLTIVSDPGNPLSVPDQQHEGLTMDEDGILYVISENGGGDFDHPQLWVYARSNVPNQAPTAITLQNAVTSILENTSTLSRVKVADIFVTDDGLGVNTLGISGPDAVYFEISGSELFIKAGTVLDYETKPVYSITVNVDDATVGGTPDASTNYTLNLIDVIIENLPVASVAITEVAPWSSGNSPVRGDWFEVTNNNNIALDITGWKMDDGSNSFASSVALNGITTIAPGESVVFIETATPATTIPVFLSTWFGVNPPAGLQVGSYSGSGVGLSTGGDGVSLFNASGILQAKISFGASPAGPFPTFDNGSGQDNITVTQLSAIHVNGAFAAVNDALEIGSPGSIGKLFISEVAPWSSGNSPVAADWFEITNLRAAPIDISGWRMDDNSATFGSSVALNGITTIAPGASVIFIETATPATTIPVFLNTWFGTNPPAGLQVGSYTGSGVGLSTGGDGVTLFDAGGRLQAKVTFGTSPIGPYPTFDNKAGLNNTSISQLSAIGVNGAFAAVNDAAEIGSPGVLGNLFISEVAPWSSGNSPVGADWFEVTNTKATAVNTTGWKMDDNSGSPAAAVALNGVNSIAPGESVIFIETSNPAATVPLFLSTWFGSNPPAGLQVGTYSGSGVGLSTGGDEVNLYNSFNQLQARVVFGTSSPAAPFKTFDNKAALNNTGISQLSVVGVNGAFIAYGDANEIGSPGTTVNLPCNEITCPGNIQTTSSPGICGSVVTFSPPAITGGCVRCAAPSNIANYTLLGVFNGHTYFRSHFSKRWSEAKEAATSLGAHLVTITSEAENNFLAGGPAWIGLTDEASEGNFTWVTGEPFVYNNWWPGEPNNTGGDEDYVYMNFYGSTKWVDYGTDYFYPFIIEFDCSGAPVQTAGLPSGSVFPVGVTTNSFSYTYGNGNTATCSFTVTVTDNEPPVLTCPANLVTPATTPAGAVVNYHSPVLTDNCYNCVIPTSLPNYTYLGEMNGHKYFRSNFSRTWNQANTMATGLGGHLVTISSAAENNLLAGVPAWIGLTDEAVEGTFAWVTGEPLSYTNWFPGEPNSNGNEDYVFMNFYGTTKWVDFGTNYFYPFIVEFACNPTLTQTAGLPGGAEFPIGVTTNSFSYTDGGGNTATCSFTVEVTAIAPPAPRLPELFTKMQHEKTMRVNTYPNPSAGDFNLLVTSSSDEPITLRILDVTGTVKQVHIISNKTKTLKVGADLPEGMYMAEITQGTDKKIVKLVKIK